MHSVLATNRISGEVVELEVKDLPSLIEAWKVAQEYAKTAEQLKDQLKQLVGNYVDDNGNSEEHDGYKFRVSAVQRMTYDKSRLRQVFDEDTLDLFLEPNKTAIDKYLKEHVEELGDASTELRNTMIAIGKGYQVIKLEKLTREL
jgi:hypothetical protein